MRFKLTRCLNVILFSLALISLFTSSAVAAEGIRDGLILCSQVVIPSLMPFMVISEFAVRTLTADIIFMPICKVLSPVLKLPATACCAVLMSMFSGYPTGASLVSGLLKSGQITSKQASRMMMFCVNAGPAMIVIAVGQGMFGSISVGVMLLACHILASLIIGVLSALFFSKDDAAIIKAKTAKSPQAEPTAEAFVNATATVCKQMLIICGYVTLFACVTALLPESASFTLPLFEVTKGCVWLAQNGHSIVLVSALLGFGGISVIFQVLALSGAQLSISKLLLSRIYHAMISAVLCYFSLKVLPERALATMSAGPQVILTLSTNTVAITLSMLLMASAMLWTAAYKK